MSPLALPPTVGPMAISLVALTISEKTRFYPGSGIFKSCASLAFLLGGAILSTPEKSLLAFDFNSLDTFPKYILIGLFCSLLGDVLLIPPKELYYEKRTKEKKKGPKDPGLFFRLGTFFFALAHVAYAYAFAQDAVPGTFTSPQFLGAFAFGILVSYFLGLLGGKPNPNFPMSIPGDMEPLVKGYIGIITLMVATATATGGTQRILGAWMFMASDCFVAFDTFGDGKVGVVGRALGWQLYFWAQMVIAGCMARV